MSLPHVSVSGMLLLITGNKRLRGYGVQQWDNVQASFVKINQKFQDL
jgi:hypothetical protein